MKNKKLWIALLGIVIIAGIADFLYQSLRDSAHPAADITDLNANYEVSEEMAKAREKLDKNPQASEVLTVDRSGRQQVALVFDGLPDRAMTARLLDVLQKYHAKAVFFVEGGNAADQPETIKLIQKAGQEIGNYTLFGVQQAEKLSQEDLLQQLCQTQKILKVMTGTEPSLFRAPRTKYTDSLLKSLDAAGIQYAVKSNVPFPRGTLHSQEDADAFAAELQPGSIIAIPSGVAVEMKTYEPGKTNERPAIDKRPTITDDASAPARPKEDLADEVERLLAALQQRNMDMEFVDGFRHIHYIPVLPATEPQAEDEAAAEENQQE